MNDVAEEIFCAACSVTMIVHGFTSDQKKQILKDKIEHGNVYTIHTIKGFNAGLLLTEAKNLIDHLEADGKCGCCGLRDNQEINCRLCGHVIIRW